MKQAQVLHLSSNTDCGAHVVKLLLSCSILLTAICNAALHPCNLCQQSLPLIFYLAVSCLLGQQLCVFRLDVSSKVFNLVILYGKDLEVIFRL